MSKLVDIEVIRKEIEKRKRILEGLFESGDGSIYSQEDTIYHELLTFLDTLPEEKPVDLEEEIHDYLFWEGEKNVNFSIVRDSYHAIAEKIARHFYELGRKGGGE